MPAQSFRTLLIRPEELVVLQRREIAHTTDELGWESLPDSLISLDAVQQDVTDTIWEGVMKIPDPAPYPLRLVVVEHEVFLSTASIFQPTARELEGRASVPGFSRFGMIDPGLIYPARMVFADSIEIAS